MEESMSVLWRILSVAALVVSAVILILSILTVRKESRVRPGLDLLRLAVTLVTTVLMARLLGVTTSEALMGLGLLVGLLLGVYEGLHLQVRFLGKSTFARRTVLGVAAWGAGVLVVQGAGVIGRIGLADIGLALSFLGIGQVVGLLAGRWQTVLSARRATAGAAVGGLVLLSLAGAALPWLAPSADADDAVEVRAVMAGQVAGLAVEVRGNGAFMGPALSLTFTNETGAEVAVTVPAGLQFLPENQAAQTMIAAGGETIPVPPTEPGSGYTVEIQAFCGQFHDDIPSPDDIFHAGEMVTGDRAALVSLINQEGAFGRDQQEAIWNLTDGYDISGNAAAGALVDRAAQGAQSESPVQAVDDDPENLMWNCGTSRAAFGDPAEDRSRCLTFRYDVPGGGIQSAVVYLTIEAPTGSLQDTDSVAVAVATAFPDQCALAGDMAGCVQVHGGFAGGERSLTVDLLDLACDASFTGTQEMQEAVRAQLETGVLHMILQDDTAVIGGRLALNEGPAALPCGTSTEAAPVAPIVPCHCSELTAGEGARTSVAGLAGAAALLLTALAGSGNTLGSAAAAWRGGGRRGLLDLVGRGAGARNALPDWVDPQAALGRGRAGAALGRLPSGLREQVAETLAARLETEQADRLFSEVQKSIGKIDPAADAAEVLRSHPKASGLLERLPAEVRSRFEAKLLAGLQDQQAAGAAEEAAGALRRDYAVGLLRRAIEQRDGGTVQRVLAAAGEEGPTRVWPRAVAGLESQANALEYPPPGPEGTAALPPYDLDGYLDAGGGGAGALPAGGDAEAVFSRLAAGMRAQARGQLAEKLEAGRVARWVGKLRPAAGAGAGSVLEARDTERLLGLLPPGVRQQVGEAAARVIDGEAVEGMTAAVRRLVEQNRAVELLRAAAGMGDGDRADAIMSAVTASLDTAERADLDRLVQRAVPGGIASLQRLARTGAAVPPVDLTEHLAGEADLLAAARRSEGVEALLQRAGSLRPQVEADLARVLEANRLGRAVRKAAELVSPGEQAASDIMETVRQLPGVRDLFAGLPAASRREAYRLLEERLGGERLEAAVADVARAVSLDQAEATLRRAAAAGDLDAADAALAGLTPDQAREVSAAAFGG
jgi:hypothetical protein